MIPWWLLALLCAAAFAGGYLMAAGTSRPRCVVCGKALARVCPEGRCGGTPGTRPVSTPDPNGSILRGALPHDGTDLRGSGDNADTNHGRDDHGWASHVDTALAIGGAA
ncbi:hypothetical protein HDA40_006117 [Hamadaea flava]|nr:hypothetical protein [Hamadaea flava]